ncbi:MAG TPA: hypothetical protein VGA92_02810 [Candidatus Nitrosotenuis sp.]
MENTPIKDILYGEINHITESRILQEISSKNYSKIINEILTRCIPIISKLDGDSFKIFGTFAESMMHYLLTNALIPSQRKITIKNIDLDITIPDSRTLDTSPKDAIILVFAKTSEQDTITNYLKKLQKIQPIKENIWIISKSKLDIPCKTYELESKERLSTILDDINDFLLSRPQSKFRIFKTKL